MAPQRLNQLLKNHVMEKIAVLYKRGEKRKRKKSNNKVRVNFWRETMIQTMTKVTRVIMIKIMIMVEVLVVAVAKAMKVVMEKDT